ncbi:MAG: hypothetical protein JKX85_06865 [Phycisphaeraceae bacterium]|nr:hypothetical protein [Phycisphaeraceae bacterium]
MLSLNRLGTKEQAVFKPELLGKWVDLAEKKETWTFVEDEDVKNSYTLTVTDNDPGKGINVFHALLFNIDGHLFLEMVPHQSMLAQDKSQKRGELYDWCLLPGHLIAQVRAIEPNLKMSFLSMDIADKLTLEQLEGIDIQKIQNRVVITSPTSELRAFISRIVAVQKAWGDQSDLSRAKP